MAKQLKRKPRLSAIITSLIQGNDYDKEVPYYFVLVESEKLRGADTYLSSNTGTVARIGMADVAAERIEIDMLETKSPPIPEEQGDDLDKVLGEAFEKFHNRFRDALLNDTLNDTMIDFVEELKDQTGNILEDEN
jgi:hypothetical protein